MNYEILKNENLFFDFLKWLPELQPNEKYYVCLFARSKYQNKENVQQISHISSDKSQLKRFSATKENLYWKIKQLECEIGSYVQYKNDGNHIPIPQESLAIYITANPRCEKRAMQNSAKKFVDLICNGNNIVNPSNFAMSELQRSKSRTIFKDFDFDYVSYDELKDEIFDIFKDRNVYHILQTRGGFHLLVDVKKATQQNTYWYKQVMYLPNIDIADKDDNDLTEDEKAGNMIPIVGCTQGNFVPYFISY